MNKLPLGSFPIKSEAYSEIPYTTDSTGSFKVKSETYAPIPKRVKEAEDQQSLQFQIDNKTGNYLTISRNKVNNSYKITLWSKTNIKLSSIDLPRELPSTINNKNKYLQVDNSGNLVWSDLAADGATLSVLYDTTDNWLQKENTTITKSTVFYVYTDKYSYFYGNRHLIVPGIKLGINGVLLSAVPFITDYLTSQLENKVDKVPGKGLSTNDLTDELVQKIRLATTINTIYLDSSATIGTLSSSAIASIENNKFTQIIHGGRIYYLANRAASYYTYYSAGDNVAEVSYLKIDKATRGWRILNQDAQPITKPSLAKYLKDNIQVIIDAPVDEEAEMLVFNFTELMDN